MRVSNSWRLAMLAMLAVLSIGACSAHGRKRRPRRRRGRDRRERPCRGPSRSTAPARSSRSPRRSPRTSRGANAGVQVPVAAVGHGRRVQEVLRRRDRHQRRLAADQGRRRGRRQGLHDQQHRVRRAADRHRRPDGRRQPGEHVRDVPDEGRARRRSTARTRPRTSSGATSDAGLPGPAGQPVHAGRRLGHVRLLHRGDQRRGRRGDASSRRQSEDDNVLVTGVAGDVNAIGVLRLRVLRREPGQAQGRRGRRRLRLRRADRGDDQRQHATRR